MVSLNHNHLHGRIIAKNIEENGTNQETNFVRCLMMNTSIHFEAEKNLIF